MTELASRFGYRGLWLIVAGAAWIMFGCGVAYSPTPDRAWVLHEQIPDLVSAACWWLTGVIAIWQGTRGPGRSDYLGHVALYLMPAIRVVSYGLAWIAWLVSTSLADQHLLAEPIGYEYGYYAAGLWLLVSALLGVAASWPNPVAPAAMPRDRDDLDDSGDGGDALPGGGEA